LAKQIQEPAEGLVCGKLVKANHAGAPIGVAQLFLRQKQTGQLIDVSHRTRQATGASQDLLKLLVDACAESAAAAMPYSYSGVAGLWTQRADLPVALSALTKRRLEELGTLALESGALVKARTTWSQGAPKYLDVPDGPLAKGVGEEMFQGSRAEAIAQYRARKAG
jgi:hypothetical protein